MFKKTCKSHTYSPTTSKEVEVTQPGEGTGSVEAEDLAASVKEVKAMDSGIKCRGGGELS